MKKNTMNHNTINTMIFFWIIWLFMATTVKAFNFSKWPTLPPPPFGPVLWGEMQAGGVDPQMALVHGSLMTLHNVLREGQHILAPVVADEVQVLQCGYDVLFLYAGHLTDLLDGDVGSLAVV